MFYINKNVNVACSSFISLQHHCEHHGQETAIDKLELLPVQTTRTFLTFYIHCKDVSTQMYLRMYFMVYLHVSLKVFLFVLFGCVWFCSIVEYDTFLFAGSHRSCVVNVTY